ncbi:MAG: recombinase family protein [Candidatus Sulfotelmatobacter sp.]
MKTIAIYTRVSTRKQDNENQLLQLREFASKQDGWEIITEFVDTVSGSGKKERRQFDEMMLAASQKKFDLLLFWSLDRLSREGILKTLGYLEQLKGWGIGWRAYTQPFLDTGNEMTNSIVLSVLAAVAKQERITISERTRAGLQRARRTGVTLGRPMANVDMKLVERRRAKGESLRSIAAAMGVSAALLCKRAAQAS